MMNFGPEAKQLTQNIAYQSTTETTCLLVTGALHLLIPLGARAITAPFRNDRALFLFTCLYPL